MSDGLTLNKITSQRGISIGEAARRIADLGWKLSYVQEAMTFPTDYKISKAPRDPMKQVLRSYFPMQKEKDNRVYGALDAALRGDMFRNVEPRWIEWRKLFLAIIPFPQTSPPPPRRLGSRPDGDARRARARRRTADRLHDADGRRVPALDDSDESEEMVHGKLYRPGRVRYYRGGIWQMLRHHHWAPVRRRISHRRCGDRSQRVSAGGRRNGIHQYAVCRDAGGSGTQWRLCVADGIFIGAVRRKLAHRQWPFARDVDHQRPGQSPAARARPALRLLAKPRDRRCGHRHLHRIWHRGS